MSKLTEVFKTVGIHNCSNFAGKEVYIYKRNRDTWITPAWVVRINGQPTDANAAWYDNGCKTFSCYHREDIKQSLEDAKKWAGGKYGINEWAKTPYGSWMDAKFVKSRLAQLKEQVKQNGSVV